MLWPWRSASSRRWFSPIWSAPPSSRPISTPRSCAGSSSPFFDVARDTLEEHGGTIEKYIGDAVLAVFGVPRAHGDDPDRAVAAALALVERVRAVDPALGVRVGVEAGDSGRRPELPAGPGEGRSGEAATSRSPGRPSTRPRACSRQPPPGRSWWASAPPAPAAAPGSSRARRSRRRGSTAGLPTLVATGAAEGEPEQVTRLVGREDDLELLQPRSTAARSASAFPSWSRSPARPESASRGWRPS